MQNTTTLLIIIGILSCMFVTVFIAYLIKSVTVTEYRKRIRGLITYHTFREREINTHLPGHLTFKNQMILAGLNAKAKGFEKKEWGTLLMMTVSELADSIEADRIERSGEKLIEDGEETITIMEYFDRRFKAGNSEFVRGYEVYIKDTREAELASTIIRILTICFQHDIDIEKYLRYAMMYNQERPYLHGKKY